MNGNEQSLNIQDSEEINQKTREYLTYSIEGINGVL